MDAKPLRDGVSEQTWQEFSARLKSAETMEVLRELFDYITEALAPRLDDIKADDGRTLSFFSQGREILTINVTRKDLRIYIHPPAGASFEPDFPYGEEVERFSLWQGSFRKTSGDYRGMSVWISEKKYLPGVKKTIDRIPKTRGDEAS